MRTTNNEAGNIAIAVVAIVAGLVIGFAAGRVMNNNKKSTTTTTATAPTSDTKAADLRSDLVTLGVEHMTLTDQAVDAALDGSPDASATAAALYANGNDIGAAVGSI